MSEFAGALRERIAFERRSDERDLLAGALGISMGAAWLRKRYVCYRGGVLHWIAVNKVEAKAQKILLIQGLVDVRGRHRAPTLVKVTA